MDPVRPVRFTKKLSVDGKRRPRIGLVPERQCASVSVQGLRSSRELDPRLLAGWRRQGNLRERVDCRIPLAGTGGHRLRPLSVWHAWPQRDLCLSSACGLPESSCVFSPACSPKPPRTTRQKMSQPILWLLTLFVVATSAAQAQVIDVQVTRRGEGVVVDVRAAVKARPAYAWAVLTDYDHMAEFVTVLTSSAVTGRTGNLLQVAQTGQVTKAFLHFSFSTLRAVELTPMREIRSHLIRGDFKSYEFTTRIIEQESGTLLIHHGEYVPNVWVPPLVGPTMIEAETRQQYQELTAEILRRQALTEGPRSSATGDAPATSGTPR